MNRQTAMFWHVLAIGLQGVNVINAVMKLGVFPSGWTPYIAIGLAAAQAAIGWIQHNFNPDGTPATVAFIPK